MARSLALVLMLALAAACLSGCYDAQELDDVSRVVAIGVDLGVSDAWRLTVQVPTLQGDSAQSGAGGGSGYTMLSIDAPSFFVAVEMLNSSMLRTLNFSHAHFLAFSEELARSGKIGEYIAPIIRYGKIRRTANVVVVRGSAMDFVKANEPLIGTSAAKTLQTLSQDSEEISFFPEATLESFYEALKAPNRQPLAPLAAVNDMKGFQESGPRYAGGYQTGGTYLAGQLPRQGKNKLELFGTAVFVGDRMVDQLNGDETRFLLMATGRLAQSFYSVPDPTHPDVIIALDVTGERPPDVAVSFDGENPRIALTVYLDGDITAVQSRAQYEIEPLRGMLEAQFKAMALKGIQGVFEKLKAHGADAFGFGNYASRSFRTIQQMEDYGWTEHFKHATLSVTVDFKIRRTGTQIKSSPLEPEDGREGGR